MQAVAKKENADSRQDQLKERQKPFNSSLAPTQLFSCSLPLKNGACDVSEHINFRNKNVVRFFFKLCEAVVGKSNIACCRIDVSIMNDVMHMIHFRNQRLKSCHGRVVLVSFMISRADLIISLKIHVTGLIIFYS